MKNKETICSRSHINQTWEKILCTNRACRIGNRWWRSIVPYKSNTHRNYFKAYFIKKYTVILREAYWSNGPEIRTMRITLINYFLEKQILFTERSGWIQTTSEKENTIVKNSVILQWKWNSFIQFIHFIRFNRTLKTNH